MTDEDLYAVLGVPKTATQDEIKAAYRQKAKEAHPDTDTGSEEAMQRLNQAYKILSDETKRGRYDVSGVWDDGPDNTESVALELLDMMLTNYINDEQAKFRNIIEEMDGALFRNETKCQNQVISLHAQAKRTEDLIKRFRTKKSRNLVVTLLMRKLATIRGSVNVQEQAVAAHKKAREILRDYDFDVAGADAFGKFFQLNWQEAKNNPPGA